MEETYRVSITAVHKRENKNSITEEIFLIEAPDVSFETANLKTALQAFMNRLK